MPKVHFVNDDRTIELPAGRSIAQAAQEAGASLPFGCRAGTCGSCVCRVVEGDAYREDRGFVEEDTLAVLRVLEPGVRLGCQMILKRGEDLRLRW